MSDVKVFTFTGLRRSGNHPIIYWISRCIDNGNIPEEMSDVHPLDNIFHNSSKTLYFFNDWLDYKTNYLNNNNIKVNGEYMLYSYEDVRMNYTQQYTDPNVTNIIILRDPLNTMASRIKHKMDQLSYYISSEDVIDIWKAYASECLNITKKFKNLLFILYNRWVVDKKYRKDICGKLNIPYFSDTKYVPLNGNGSSFIGRKLESDPNIYNKRYELIDFNETQIKLLDDPELHELSSKLFPDINIKDFLSKYHKKFNNSPKENPIKNDD